MRLPGSQDFIERFMALALAGWPLDAIILVVSGKLAGAGAASARSVPLQHIYLLFNNKMILFKCFNY